MTRQTINILIFFFLLSILIAIHKFLVPTENKLYANVMEKGYGLPYIPATSKENIGLIQLITSEEDDDIDNITDIPLVLYKYDPTSNSNKPFLRTDTLKFRVDNFNGYPIARNVTLDNSTLNLKKIQEDTRIAGHAIGLNLHRRFDPNDSEAAHKFIHVYDIGPALYLSSQYSDYYQGTYEWYSVDGKETLGQNIFYMQEKPPESPDGQYFIEHIGTIKNIRGQEIDLVKLSLDHEH